MQQPSIIVKDLAIKKQDGYILEGISFSLFPGQHLAIIGESGSGKTSLGKALAGQIFFSGKIEKNFKKDASKSQQVVFVEARNTFKNLSNTSDFYYQQRFNSFDATDSPKVIDELVKTMPFETETEKIIKIESGLRKLGISHLQNAPLIQLSGGEHKRFQLLKALLIRPQLLILDCPFNALDVEACKGLNEILNEVAASGTQLIIIPGTFEIPGCITHVLQSGAKQFFGEKEEVGEQNENQIEQQQEYIYLPLENENAISEAIIKMENVSIRYGERNVIENFNWQVKKGEKWLLKGANGVGKSSLLNLITGDHPQAYSNGIWLFGKKRGSGESIWDIKKKTGYVSVELQACYDKTIFCFDAIASGFFDTIGLYKKLTSVQHNKVIEWLDALQLTSEDFYKPLYKFSNGVQRLIMLARALVKDPPLLILDEPCQGLDFAQRDWFLSFLNTHSGEGKTLIYVTHAEEEVPEIIEKVLELKAGRQTFFEKKLRKMEEEIIY
jgi:molybdate transport system ATP-binding protein